MARSDSALAVTEAILPTVRTVLAGFPSHGFPVDVEDIAASQGIHLLTCQMPPNVLGALNLTSEGWVLLLAHQAPSRRRWTVAHELGHHLLHSGRARPVMRTGTPGRDWVLEVEANAFARHLLMPTEACENSLAGHPESEWPRVLAETFGVSLSAARWRLVELNLGLPPKVLVPAF